MLLCNMCRIGFFFPASGLQNLTNVKPGDYYGSAAGWDSKTRLRFGAMLLYRAFHIFLQEGETQLRVEDVRVPR